MPRIPDLHSKALQALRQNPRVANIENEGCDDERFFVHLNAAWTYTYDPHQVIHTRSFARAADALKAVRDAVPAATYPLESTPC